MLSMTSCKACKPAATAAAGLRVQVQLLTGCLQGLLATAAGALTVA